MDQDIPLIQKVICVLWPSFLTAGVTTVIFFTIFDPHDLLSYTEYAELDRLGAYSIGFFLFWLVTGASCSLSVYFGRPCNIRKPPKQDHG